jgi:hypothetical protein
MFTQKEEGEFKLGEGRIFFFFDMFIEEEEGGFELGERRIFIFLLKFVVRVRRPFSIVADFQTPKKISATKSKNLTRAL